MHFTTDPSGQVHQGLEHLPIGDGSRPVLFVANHQTLALDIGFIIEDVLRAKGRLLRGLAHPAVFAVRWSPAGSCHQVHADAWHMQTCAECQQQQQQQTQADTPHS